MNRRILQFRYVLTAALILLLLFAGWGSVGHKIINLKAMPALPSGMSPYQAWTTFMGNHASDADYRKDTDPNEAPRHYIDIDEYPEFRLTGRISQSLDSVILQHGQAFVNDQGTLPWVVIKTTDSLRGLFSRRDWTRAQITAADLGHYVGDAHMPLHITRNYNGQYTGQTGVHSRYESTMIGKVQSQLVYDAPQGGFVDNVSNFVFGFLYENYKYVDSVLRADSISTAVSGGTGSTAYYNKLWELTGPFTLRIFTNASSRLASLIFTAWMNAGSPDPTTFANAFTLPEDYTLTLKAYPNPFNGMVSLQYFLPVNAVGDNLTLVLLDNLGREMLTVPLNSARKGLNSFPLDLNQFPSGIYYAKLITRNSTAAAKLLLLK